MQVYRPLEFLFTIAAFTTLAENFLPQLIALPKVRLPFWRKQLLWISPHLHARFH